MKKLIKFCLTGIAICCFSSCEKETQKLIDEISGSYTIEEIKYLSDNGKDSILSIDSGVMDFEACTLNAKKNNGLCNGFYQINNASSIDFKYNADLDERILINVTDFNNAALNLSGHYQIITKTDNILVLETGTNDGVLHIELSR